MKIATIARDVSHSPNMAANDAAILGCVADELRAKGLQVIEATEAELPDGCVAVCHMSRSPEVLERLKEAERCGVTVINSPTAVENCSRRKMMLKMREAGIKQPQYSIIDERIPLDSLRYPAWLKRADGWSTHCDDVCFVRNADEAKEAFDNMVGRGITGVVHCEHVAGDIVKFYGVGKGFFRYIYPDPEKSKFGLEKINGAPHRYPFSLDEMKSAVFSAAESIGLEIYGGDSIVCNDGAVYIIDMNDFPSFSAIRDEAAREIAGHIINRINEER